MQPWQKNLIVVWFANFFTSFGLMAIIPFFPVYLRDLGLQDPDNIKLWSGILVGAAPLTAGIMGSFWGAFGDRFGRKAMVVRAQGAVCVFIGLMFFATNPWHLLVLRLLQGTFSGYLAPSMTLVSVIAPASKQGIIGGRITSAMVAGSVAGPMLGGFLSHHAGLAWLSLICAATSSIGVLLVLIFATEPEHSAAPNPNPVSPAFSLLLVDLWKDLRQALSNPYIRAVIGIMFLSRMASSAVEPTLIVYVEELLGGASAFSNQIGGFVYNASPLASLIFLPYWGRLADKKGPTHVLFLCVLLAGILGLLQGLVISPYELAGLRFIWGAFVAGIFPSAFSLFAGSSTRERRGTAFGIAFSSFTFALFAGLVFGGIIAAVLGQRILFFIAGGILLFASWQAYRVQKSRAVIS